MIHFSNPNNVFTITDGDRIYHTTEGCTLVQTGEHCRLTFGPHSIEFLLGEVVQTKEEIVGMMS